MHSRSSSFAGPPSNGGRCRHVGARRGPAPETGSLVTVPGAPGKDAGGALSYRVRCRRPPLRSVPPPRFGQRAHRSVVSMALRIFQSARRAQPIGARSAYFPRFRRRYPYRTVKTTQPGHLPVTAGWQLPTPTSD
ncbi:hypothetical protein CSB93_3001 [Pseudomonas paraeruginosa]|uniref:Uncharacterized protein n=1 Tax=Pseudomonas paraeruginosa TaxID=2994495 RepID=A0A2R3J2X2_9PSED|nr:hypothetical protein CSB93_3001 [Pseudomonas paraeruginosa]AWE90680.1 hypothetical protein CSC28_1776 [Pseudomonas paraeruginosa]